MIACLRSPTLADEATLAYELGEQTGDPIACQGLIKGSGNVMVSNRVAMSKKPSETRFYLRIIYMESLSKRYLLHTKPTHLRQQLAVGGELESVNVNASAVVIAILHLNVALQREAERADEREGYSIASL